MEEKNKEEVKEETDLKQIKTDKKVKKKMKVVAVHEDLVEKEAFYEKFDLNMALDAK